MVLDDDDDDDDYNNDADGSSSTVGTVPTNRILLQEFPCTVLAFTRTVWAHSHRW